MSPDPGRTAVYHIRGEAAELLYIGMTNSVPHRWNQHMLIQPWWSELRSMTFEFYDTRDAAEAAEKAAILTERPKYNKTYLVRPRRQPKPARVRVAPQPALAPARATVSPGRWDGPMLTPEEAAAFLDITEGELRDLRRTDPALRAYDLDLKGNYIRFLPYELWAYKSGLAKAGAA